MFCAQVGRRTKSNDLPARFYIASPGRKVELEAPIRMASRHPSPGISKSASNSSTPSRSSRTAAAMARGMTFPAMTVRPARARFLPVSPMCMPTSYLYSFILSSVLITLYNKMANKSHFIIYFYLKISYTGGFGVWMFISHQAFTLASRSLNANQRIS